MERRTRYIVRCLLLTAHVLLPLAAFAFSHWQVKDWSAHNVFRVVLFSEAGLLCVWAGLGSQAWQRRLVGTLAGLAFCWLLLWFRETKQTPLMLVESLLFTGAPTVVLAVVIKSSPAYTDDQTGVSRRWQFTVSQLLVVTSLVGVLIVLTQQFLKGNIAINPRLVVAEGAQIGMLVMVWAALPRRWRKMRLAAGALVACAIGLIVQSFMSESWFWDALRGLRTVGAHQLWEDLFSIPAVMLFESLLAAATVIAPRSASSPRSGPPEKRASC